MSDGAASSAAAAAAPRAVVPAVAPAAEPKSGARAWCFTVNNPEFDILYPDGLEGSGIQYLVYQKELGAEGTPHLQGYVYFRTTKKLSAIKKLTFRTPERINRKPFERAHLEISRGTPEENKTYCTKDDTRIAGPWEMGEMPKKSGSRTDLADAINAVVASNGDMTAIDPVVFVRYHRGLQALVTDRIAPPHRPNLKVITMITNTGLGKSHAIQELYPEVSKCQWGNGGAWFPGYRGQPVLAFEEFRGQIPLQRMLQYLDKYPTYLEQKGCAFPARYTLCFVTSNSEPKEWYKNDPMHPRDEELNALYRRLDYDITGANHGIRYINAKTRDELHRKLQLALSIENLEPRSAHYDAFFGLHLPVAPAPALAIAPAPQVPQAAAAPKALRTPPLSDSEEPPLRRQKATLHGPADVDMITTPDGEMFVRDDILSPWFDCQGHDLNAQGPSPAKH
ncbi:Rep [uncultured virus]|uniref:Rep n=1 Tax=uncultured virus TaxID=340016 RepID=A0A2K9LS03_9VIRU|nr:Rep [uncultured virus]